MIELTADESTLLKEVGQFVQPVEIYDGGGRLLGLFVPANLERGKQIQKQALAEIDWAEIERQVQSPEESYPFEVVRERLGRLAKEVERRKTAGEKDLTEEETLALLDSWRQRSRSPRDQAGTESGSCATP
jgi:hypothetical protein